MSSIILTQPQKYPATRYNRWVEHTVLCPRSSQLKKYKAAHLNIGVKHTQRYDRAVHNCKNIRPHGCLVK